MNPSTFNPTKLDVNNWIQSIKELGAKHAIITVKHGCGFLLWPTDVRLPDGWPYGYDVAHTTSRRNVLKEFVDSIYDVISVSKDIPVLTIALNMVVICGFIVNVLYILI